ncbi:MAG TPA: hypothetical protein DCQ98_01290 [Planctomycetaceae bacterium]|nr:hypothetical protein [Planctomycetaceae bacterium]HRF01891.1 hypothetical protein [Pirellulaceae bacterium]
MFDRAKGWTWLELASAAVLVLTIRGAALAFSGERLAQDPDAYVSLARVWSRTGTFGVERESSAEPPSAATNRLGSLERPETNPSEEAASAFSDATIAASQSGESRSTGNEVAREEPKAADMGNAPADASRVADDGVIGRPEVRPTAYRPPFYPALLALLDRLGWLTPLGIGLLNLSAGAGTVLLLGNAIVGRSGRRVAWVAVVLMAIDPLSVLQSLQAMTETWATFLAVAGGLAFVRFSRSGPSLGGLATGMLFGLGALCRPPLLVWGALLLLIEAAVIAVAAMKRAKYQVKTALPRAETAGNDGGPRDTSTSETPIAVGRASSGEEVRPALRLAGLGLIAAALLATLFPWGLRNQLVLGEFRVTTTHGGYTLLLANNPSLYRAMRGPGDPRDWLATSPDFVAMLREADPEPVRQAADEVRRDRAWNDAAKRVIREDPWGFMQSVMMRVGWFWGLAPHLRDTWSGRLVMLAVAAFHGAIFSLAIAAIVRRSVGDRLWWQLGLLALVLTAMHAIWWSNPRMRTPVAPWICWTAAASVTAFGKSSRPSAESGSARAAGEPKNG